MAVATIRFEMHPPIAVVAASIEAVVQQLEKRLHLIPVPVEDALDLQKGGWIRWTPILGRAAGGAGVLTVLAHPGNRLLNFVAAIASDRNEAAEEVEIRVLHGWPVLSLREASATIAGEGADTKAALPGDSSVSVAA